MQREWFNERTAQHIVGSALGLLNTVCYLNGCYFNTHHQKHNMGKKVHGHSQAFSDLPFRKIVFGQFSLNSKDRQVQLMFKRTRKV